MLGTHNRTPTTLYFLTDELEEYYRRVSEQPNGRILKPIEAQPWVNTASTVLIYSETSSASFKAEPRSLEV
jgi:hypothetical protein